MTVEVKIGVQNTARELVVESEETNESITALVKETLASDNGVLTLSDTKGKVTVVPVAKLAYVEIGRSTTGQVGFRS